MIRKQHVSHLLLLACLMIKTKVTFWRAGFFPANQGYLKTFSDCSDWLDKSRPSKQPVLL